MTKNTPPLVRNRMPKKIIALLILAFVASFLIRFSSGFFMEFERSINTSYNREYSSVRDFTRISYQKAVSNNYGKLTLAQATVIQNFNLLEVFAKEAQLRSTTDQFENDESNARSSIEKQGGLIRIEQKSGLKPHRALQLVVRVPETKFDGLVTALQNMGTAETFHVSKEDQSEEAKNLLVEKKSLEDYRNSLVALIGPEKSGHGILLKGEPLNEETAIYDRV